MIIGLFVHRLCIEYNRIETFKKCKIDVTSSNALEVKKGKSRDVSGRDPKLASAREMYYGRGYASLNK